MVNGGSFSDMVVRKLVLGEMKWFKVSYVVVNKYGVIEIYVIYYDIIEYENVYFVGKVVIDVLNKLMVVIEFYFDGIIIMVNENFIVIVKYCLVDI